MIAEMFDSFIVKADVVLLTLTIPQCLVVS